MKKKIAILLGLLMLSSMCFIGCKHECDVCGGDGLCWECGGDGKFLGSKCPACKGDGKCPNCNGDEKVKKSQNKPENIKIYK